MNKKFWLIAGVLLLIAALLGSMIVGCAKPAPAPSPSPSPAPAPSPSPTPTPTPSPSPTPTPTPSPSPTPTPTPSPSPTPTPTPTPTSTIPAPDWKGVTWDYSSYSSSTSGIPLMALHFAELIKERTQDRLKFRWHWSASLVPTKEEPAALRAGLSTMASIYTAQLPRPYPLFDYLNIPGVTPALSLEQIFAMQIAWTEHPLIQAELKEMNIMQMWMPWTLAGGFNIYENKPIRTAADLKGRVQRWTGDIAKFMSQAGVECVPLPFGEIYSAAQTGIIDGFGLQEYLAPIYKLAEVTKYNIVDFELVAGMSNGNFLNLDAWNALPPEIQKIVEDSAKEAGEWGITAAQSMRDDGFKYAQENFEEIIKFPPEERAKVFALGMVGLEEGWIKEMESRGLGTQAKELVDWAHQKKAEIEATIK